MNHYIKYIPLTWFAAAVALGGSLSAMDTGPEGTRMRNQQDQKQLSARNADKLDYTNSHPMTASEVIGMNIDTAANDKIGEIDEVFIDSDTGEVLAMVVSTGGFLGMGQQQSLISPEDLRFNSDRTLLQADLTKDQIQTAPPYVSGETTGLDRVRPLGKSAGLGHKASSNPMTTEEHMDRMIRPNGVQANGRGLAVSELIGMNVENQQGETIGEVEEVFLDLENREVAGVVVSTGGFLGMGDRKTLFGMRELSFGAKNETVLLDYNRDQIRAFPEYKTSDQSVFSALRDRTDRLDTRGSSYAARNPVDGARTVGNQVDEDRTETRTAASSPPKRLSDMTVFDQGNSSAEIAMTASIRNAIRDDATLSNRANNLTIITSKEKVVLRGEVDSASDKAIVESIAHRKAGRENVTSELIVTSRSSASSK